MPKLNTQYHRALLAVLNKARLSTGRNRRELSRDIGRRHNFVSQIELGQRRLAVDELPEYAAGLGLTSIEVVAQMEAEHALYVTPTVADVTRRLRLRKTATLKPSKKKSAKKG